jgi:hypothetical protein
MPSLIALLTKVCQVRCGASLMPSIRCFARVSLGGCLSSSLTVHRGVAQGCPLSPFLYAVFIDGVLQSVQTECADSGICAGQAPLVLQAYADDQAAASPTPLGLQRILDAMQRYGDTWGCCANTDKTHILLVGPPEAAADARRHDFQWGTSSLAVVDQVRYLGIWLTSS